MQEDSYLMEQFKLGDVESFEKLILKHREGAVAFAMRYVHDWFIAEDIAQESFAHLHVYKDRFNPKYSFKTYLYSIIKNKGIDYIRKSGRISFLDYDVPDSLDVEEKFIKDERNKVIREKIKELNDDYKLAIHLFEYEGFSYDEIGKIMDKNIAQVKIIMFRARKKLGRLLKEEI